MSLVEMLGERVAFVFPGQGTQYVGMGKAVYDLSLAARRVFQQADETLGFALSRLCFEGPEEELSDTINAQPAILTVSIATLAALREAWERLGRAVSPVFVAGHSLGEITALVAAGALDFPDAVRLVRERGRLMKESGEQQPGGMAAVIGLDEQALTEVCNAAQQAGPVVVANTNSPEQSVISGAREALASAIALARERGARAIPLKITIASHSPLMERAAAQFAEIVARLQMREPEVPIVAHIRGQLLTSVEAIRRELAEGLLRPVEWTHQVRRMVEGGADTFVEIGPGAVLARLIERINGDVRALSLSDRDLASLLGALNPHSDRERS